MKFLFVVDQQKDDHTVGAAAQPPQVREGLELGISKA